MELMTNSRAKDARRCQRRHRIRYALGYRSASEAEELRFGSLWHHGLEAWWGETGDSRLTAALAAIEAGAADPFDLVKARQLMRGYHYRWGAEQYETLAVEVEFRAPLVNPATGRRSPIWELGGKIDGVAREPILTRNLIVEHKTSSEDISPGSDYWRRLRIDGQVSIYFDGAVALGYTPSACLYDVVKKPTIRPLKATPPESRKYKKDGTLYAAQREHDETPEQFEQRLQEDIAADPSKYYGRAEVVRLDAELIEARYDLWQLARQLRENELAERYPRNPDGCFHFGRACEYFPVCTGEASLDDTSLFVRSDDKHPELTSTPTKQEDPQWHLQP